MATTLDRVRITLWFMLFSGMLVSMICQCNLSIAITSMGKNKNASNGTKNEESEYEYDWYDTKANVIISSFSWLNGVAHLAGGVLCHKYGPKKTFLISNLTMGCCSLLTVVAADVHYVLVIILRVLQGVAEGIAVNIAPTAIIAKWVAPGNFSKYMAVMLGYPLATGISFLLFGFIIHWFGWRYTFYGSGSLALVWCLLWSFLIYDSPDQHPFISAHQRAKAKAEIGYSVADADEKLKIPWKSIFLSFPYWVNTVCVYGTIFTLAAYSMYLPTFLTKVHDLDVQVAGVISGFPYILNAVFSLSFCTYTDYLQKRKLMSKNLVRKFSTMFSGVMGGLITMVIGYTDDIVLTALLLCISIILNGALPSGAFSNIIDLSPNFCGVMKGIQGFLIGTVGIFIPIVVEFFTAGQHTKEQWGKVFLCMGGLNFCSSLLFVLFSKAEVQKWNFPPGDKVKEGQPGDIQANSSV